MAPIFFRGRLWETQYLMKRPTLAVPSGMTNSRPMLGGPPAARRVRTPSPVSGQGFLLRPAAPVRCASLRSTPRSPPRVQISVCRSSSARPKHPRTVGGPKQPFFSAAVFDSPRFVTRAGCADLLPVKEYRSPCRAGGRKDEMETSPHAPTMPNLGSPAFENCGGQ